MGADFGIIAWRAKLFPAVSITITTHRVQCATPHLASPLLERGSPHPSEVDTACVRLLPIYEAVRWKWCKEFFDAIWVQDWVQLESKEWLRIFGKRHQIGHLDFCPPRLLTEGLLVR